MSAALARQRALSAGAGDILNIALDADCGSHEAYTRAFRDHFGMTPKAVRATMCLGQLELQDSTALDTLARPRFETGKAMPIAGVGDQHKPRQGRRHFRPVAAL